MHKIKLSNTEHIDNYKKLLPAEDIDSLYSLAAKLKGKKIVEINATSFGGGVAELLRSQIPLMRELGLDIDWYVLPANDQFFNITKQLHNCLQGICPLHPNVDIEYYQAYLDDVAKNLPEADIYILHDPQTLGLAQHLQNKKVIWRCHIDLTAAEDSTHNWLTQHYQYFSKVIFSLESYMAGIEKNKAAIVYPAIDPFSKKNYLLSDQECQKIITQHPIDINKPYILQVSRFDKFKNPLGVLHIFSELQKQMPEMQCILMGNYATDDPEGQEYYKSVHKLAKQIDPYNIHIIVQTDDITINAFQRRAAAVIQNSNKEGFGLTVTEALWKQKIVFSRPVGGITLQILNNKTGYYLVDEDSLSANEIVKVLRGGEKHSAIVTRAGHELVKKKFITPIMVRDYLRAYTSI